MNIEVLTKIIDKVSQFMIPIAVTVVGYLVNKRMKAIELTHWQNQKLIEKRIVVYDDIAPKLNQIFCYFTYIGEWKELAPPDVVKLKRQCDKSFHTYKFIFDANIAQAYDQFMATAFQMFNEAGADARMRTKIVSGDGDRRTHANFAWTDGWERYFAEANASPKEEVRRSYNALMNSLAESIKQGADRGG